MRVIILNNFYYGYNNPYLYNNYPPSSYLYNSYPRTYYQKAQRVNNPVPLENNVIGLSETFEKNNETSTSDTRTSDNKKKFNSNWFNINNNKLTILGFSLDIDDLIIIGIALFLILENKIDVILLIILALLLFDVKLDFLGSLFEN